LTQEQFAPTTKYVIVARFDIQGVVEKPDVIGAIFGQTEGLFGPDLDLRELQKGGRIGRIEIQLDSKHDRTTGTITIPSSLDKVSTAIIAAAIESVDRIGPCDAKIILEKVEDVREEKRKVIMDKAKEILRKWVVERSPSTDETVKEVSSVIRDIDLVEYGHDKLPAGPDLAHSGSIIVVEGRADVLNLLRCGIRNAIGIEGTKIPRSVIDLCRNKEVTAFLDGDRGGDLILKELLQVADIDYIARAPAGKEVEELTPKEIMRSLRDKQPLGARPTAEPPGYHAPPMPAAPTPSAFRPPAVPQLPVQVVDKINELRGTLEAVLFDESNTELARLPVSDLAAKLPELSGVHTLVFDGVITQRLLDMAEQKGVKYVIGDRLAEVAKRPAAVRILTIPEIVGR
jgi:DNA primase